MIIAYLILYIIVNELIYSRYVFRDMGIEPFPYAASVFCTVSNLFLLVINIWYGGLILGIILFSFQMSGLLHATIGWILLMPISINSNSKLVLKFAKSEIWYLPLVMIITVIFCIVSFFTTEFSSLYDYIKQNTIILIPIAIILILLFIIRYFVNKHIDNYTTRKPSNMKFLKLLNKALVFFILSVLLSIICYAHGGKTDANGGHYNSSTGEYHYHHGYPAHQHPDGICPYSYDDKTDHSNGQSYSDDSNKSNNNYSDFNSIVNNFKDSVRIKNSQDNRKTVSEPKKDKSIACFVLLLIIIAIVYGQFYVYIEDKVKDALKTFKLFRNIVTPVAIAISLGISCVLYQVYPNIVLVLSDKEIIDAWLLWLFIAVILCIVEFVLFTYGIYVILKDKAPVTVEDIRNHHADSVERRFATLKLFEYFLLPVSIIISIGMAIFFYSAYPDIAIFISDKEIIEAGVMWVYITLILGLIELFLLLYSSKDQ